MGAQMHLKLLKIARADGQRIKAKVYGDVAGRVTIKVEYLSEVMEDNPDFAHKGQIVMRIVQADYHATILKIESYLENLFLKGIANESLPSSDGTDIDSGGNAPEDPIREIEPAEREGDSASVPSRSRRKKSTEDSG